MKFIERTLITLLIAAMVVAVHQIVGVLFESHGWKGLSPSDWAAWVQAVGSVVAICWAVWLFRAEQISRNAEQSELAQLNAAAMHHTLARTSKQLSNVSEWFKKTEQNALSYAIMHRIAKVYKDAPIWTTEELAKLTPIGNQCALKIAAAQNRMLYLAGFIEGRVKDNWANVDATRRDKIIFITMEQHNLAAAELASALKSLKKTLRHCGFFPVRQSPSDVE